MSTMTESGPNVASRSTMIAFYPPANLRRRIAQYTDADIDESSLHQTLLYLGDLDLGQFAQAQKLLHVLAKAMSPVKMSINGAGMFFNATTVLYLILNGVGLDVWRFMLLDAFNRSGLKGVCNHGGAPHMTLAYLDAEDVRDDWWRLLMEDPLVDETFVCNTIHLVRGDRVKIPFKLTGAPPPSGNPAIKM